MKIKPATLVLTGGFVLVSLAGCSHSDHPVKPTPSSTNTTAVSPSTPATTSVPAESTVPVEPTLPAGTPASSATVPATPLPEAEQRYMLVLEQVDATLTSDEAWAVRGGVRICTAAKAGANRAELINYAMDQYTINGQAPTEAVGQKIVAAAEGQLCP